MNTKSKILMWTVFGIATVITILALTLPNTASSQRVIVGTLWLCALAGQIGIWVSLSKYSSYYARFREISHMPHESAPVRAQRAWGLASVASGYLRNLSFFAAAPLTILLWARGGSL